MFVDFDNYFAKFCYIHAHFSFFTSFFMFNKTGIWIIKNPLLSNEMARGQNIHAEQSGFVLLYKFLTFGLQPNDFVKSTR